jgi:hypothetical protein
MPESLFGWLPQSVAPKVRLATSTYAGVWLSTADWLATTEIISVCNTFLHQMCGVCFFRLRHNLLHRRTSYSMDTSPSKPLRCSAPPTMTCSAPEHAFAARTRSPSWGRPWLWGRGGSSTWHRRASGWWEHEWRPRARQQESQWREGRWAQTQGTSMEAGRAATGAQLPSRWSSRVGSGGGDWTYPFHGLRMSICLNFLFKEGQRNLHLHNFIFISEKNKREKKTRKELCFVQLRG